MNVFPVSLEVRARGQLAAGLRYPRVAAGRTGVICPPAIPGSTSASAPHRTRKPFWSNGRVADAKSGPASRRIESCRSARVPGRGWMLDRRRQRANRRWRRTATTCVTGSRLRHDGRPKHSTHFVTRHSGYPVVKKKLELESGGGLSVHDLYPLRHTPTARRTIHVEPVILLRRDYRGERSAGIR
jgi:hypothetical protein